MRKKDRFWTHLILDALGQSAVQVAYRLGIIKLSCPQHRLRTLPNV